MVGVRFHGRAGQGVATAAELLAAAAMADGRHARALSTDVAASPGAPIVASCRVDDSPIRTRVPVVDPDALVVLDATLLSEVDVFAGVQPGGCALLNTGRSLEEIGLRPHDVGLRDERVFAVPATEIALARVGRPLPSAALLGGLAAFSGIVTLEAVTAAIVDRFETALADRNVVAARETYKFVDREFGREVLRSSPD
jgi:pyruvate ferredoxin oxidoreductase gamma subunit